MRTFADWGNPPPGFFEVGLVEHRGGAKTDDSDLAATRTLAQLYAASRLYINFFQPSFKLKAKTRDGAWVSKTYYPPATPCVCRATFARRGRC